MWNLAVTQLEPFKLPIHVQNSLSWLHESRPPLDSHNFVHVPQTHLTIHSRHILLHTPLTPVMTTPLQYPICWTDPIWGALKWPTRTTCLTHPLRILQDGHSTHIHHASKFRSNESHSARTHTPVYIPRYQHTHQSIQGREEIASHFSVRIPSTRWIRTTPTSLDISTHAHTNNDDLVLTLVFSMDQHIQIQYSTGMCIIYILFILCASLL